MVSYLVICLVAFLASGLTFFSGFGLGTLLLPAFAFFFPVELAVSLTAVVHFLNGLFKLALVGRWAVWPVVFRFALPASAAAFAGAWLLARLSGFPPVLGYSAFGIQLYVTPVKLAVGCALLVFASFELSARFQQLSFSPRYLAVGGLLSGFFGGLSGTQGALRSAFLVRAGLSKEGEQAVDVTAYAAQISAQLGAHVIKIKPPKDHIEQAEAKKVFEKYGIPTKTLADRVRLALENAET